MAQIGETWRRNFKSVTRTAAFLFYKPMRQNRIEAGKDSSPNVQRVSVKKISDTEVHIFGNDLTADDKQGIANFWRARLQSEQPGRVVTVKIFS
jgi:hypothetical protein